MSRVPGGESVSVCRVPKTTMVDGVKCDACGAKVEGPIGWLRLESNDFCGTCTEAVIEAARSLVAKKPAGRSVTDILDGLKPYPPLELMGPGAYRPHVPHCAFLRGEFCNCP